MTVKEQLNQILLEEWESDPSELQLYVTLNPDLKKIERVLIRAYALGRAHGAEQQCELNEINKSYNSEDNKVK